MNRVDVVIGEFYTHHDKKNDVVVVEIANESSKTWPVIVVYVDADRKTWARSLAEFLVKFSKKV